MSLIIEKSKAKTKMFALKMYSQYSILHPQYSDFHRETPSFERENRYRILTYDDYDSDDFFNLTQVLIEMWTWTRY